MGGTSVDTSTASGVGIVQPDLAADLSILDEFEDKIAKDRPDLAKPTDAFTDRLQQGVIRGDPIDVAAATDATQDLIALIEQNGIKIPKNASFDDLRGLASQIDDHATKHQFMDALDKLDAALGGNANLESKAVDLLTAAGESKAQGMGEPEPVMKGKPEGPMQVEETMLGLTAQDILSMPPEVQQQILSKLSTSDLLIVATALKDKLNQIADSDGPIDEQEARELFEFAIAVKKELEKSGAAEGGMMQTANEGEGGMMEGAGEGGGVSGRDIINEGIEDDAIQDRKGEADVKGSGDAKAGGGGGGGKATIRGIAEALGRAIDDAYEALQAKADALGDDPSPSDAIDLQADSAVASALYKAAVEVINAVGKNINDGVRTRQ